MKIRTGFVSNSSSSSFIIARSALTDEQVASILDHMNYAKEHFPSRVHLAPYEDGREWRFEPYDEEYPDDGGLWVTGTKYEDDYDTDYKVNEEQDRWKVAVDDGEVIGCTWMANFSMAVFLDEIGVPDDAISWSDYSEKEFNEVERRCDAAKGS